MTNRLKEIDIEIEKLELRYDNLYDELRGINIRLESLHEEKIALINDKELADAGVHWCNE